MSLKRILSIFALCFLVLPIFFDGYVQAAEKQKAVLLLEHDQPSPWTNLLKKGLERGARDFNFQVEIVIAPPDADQTAIFRQAAGNADLVILGSDRLHEILRDNAGRFRRVKFGCVDAGIRAANIMSVTFADEQAAFLAGNAAAMLAAGANGQAGKPVLGWLAGEDTPAMRSLVNGFKNGSILDNEVTALAQAVAGSFVSPKAAEAGMNRLLDSGASVIALAAGSANGQAAEAAPDSGIWFVELDENTHQDRSLGVIVKKADRAVYEIMASAAQPQFRGKEIVVYDLKNGGVDFQMAKSLPGVPAEKMRNIFRRVGELRHELENGSIKLKSLRARTLCDCLD